MSSTIPFDAERRRQLLLDRACAPGGTTVLEVHQAALEQGDEATPEAYYNLARRLVHRGLLVVDPIAEPKRFTAKADPDAQWLEEEDLANLVDPDYPLVALPVWREVWRQAATIPAAVWIELRERLAGRSARGLFFEAILSYADNVDALIAEFAENESGAMPERSGSRAEVERQLAALKRFVQQGLGLSVEAVRLPSSVSEARRLQTQEGVAIPIDKQALEEELARRIEDGPFIKEEPPGEVSQRPLLVGAVDGSTRGGILALAGEEGDFGLGSSPMVSINAAVGVVNWEVRHPGGRSQVVLRLPERPEDLQRLDNRYSFMAKLFHPDLSDGQYAHAVWNSMDLLEARAAYRMLKGWESTEHRIEVSAVDVVLRDGAVSPQDRDFNHYAEASTYGRIVRELIGAHWTLLLRAREGGQVVAGVVKVAQLAVYAPVINWFAAQLAGNPESQIAAWPMQAMSSLDDQPLLTRLLTAGRQVSDPWTRTCMTCRPFHALTNYAEIYSRDRSPTEVILRRRERELAEPDPFNAQRRMFWETFRPESDPFLKLLGQAWYGSAFVAMVPRLDTDQRLPRLELLLSGELNESSPFDWSSAIEQLRRAQRGIRESGGLDVAAEHSMFTDRLKLDVLPRILVRVHDTVKLWCVDLAGRIQEYVGSLLSSYVKTSSRSGRVVLRPFTRSELALLVEQLRQARQLGAEVRFPARPEPDPALSGLSPTAESGPKVPPGS